MTTQALVTEIIKKQSFLCIGLDVDLSKIPTHLLELEDPIFEFNKKIIDATNSFSPILLSVLASGKYAHCISFRLPNMPKTISDPIPTPIK